MVSPVTSKNAEHLSEIEGDRIASTLPPKKNLCENILLLKRK